MKKQTAVDWLYNTLCYKDKSSKICINIHPDCDITPEIKKAKEIEKEQSIDFARLCLNKAKDLDVLTVFINVQQYYNETYVDE